VEGEFHWQSICLGPTYISIAVLIYFILFFKEKLQIEKAA
jgi:hypothetical protein